jgi:uncharacterized protein YraI
MVRRSTLFVSFIFSLTFTIASMAEPVWYTVTGENVLVRCGADSTYYAFTTAEQGSLVAVTSEKYNWARVSAVGTNFEDAWGYIKYPASKPGRFELGVDGASGTTLGATPVLAPNMNADDIAHSWRQLCILPRGEQVVIIETKTVEKDALHAEPHVVHKVRLPALAEGWINMADLEIATTTETIEKPEVVEVEAADAELVMGDQFLTETVEEDQVEVEIVLGDSLLVQWMATDVEPTTEDVVVEETVEEVEVVELTYLEQLESAYGGMTIAELDPSELVCLHEEYLAASEVEVDPIRAEFARMRARQIEVYATLNAQETDITSLRSRVEKTTQDAVDREFAIASTGEYEVVGRLETSAVFNGNERPRLYRIRDSRTGRTLAYMRPNDDLVLPTMVGQHIGVMGLKRYDPGLQVNIVNVARVDLLASNTAFVPVD